jgi:regulator of sigma E protease
MTVIVSIVAFLVAVAILVTFHEFGHFILARLLGVKVLRFSVGFGKPLLRWRRGEGTEYVLSALPFGGYVKMLDEREGEVPEAERARAFNRQSIWRRVLILLAGPGFNILLALILYWIVFMAGVPGIKPVVGAIAPNSPAAKAGLLEHSTIQSVGGKTTPTWQAARLAMLDAVMLGQPIRLGVVGPGGAKHERVLRYASIATLTQKDNLLPGLGLSIWLPPLKPVIGNVESDSAAARAGLRAGDRILAVNGEAVTRWQQVVKRVQSHPARRMTLKVARGDATREIPVVVGAHKTDGKTTGFLGVGVKLPKRYAESLRTEYQMAVWPAFRQGAARTGEVTSMTAVMLYRMVSGEASARNLSGPIGIAQAAGSLAEAGIVPYLLFLALISVSLGILNLLPIPILDGGQLFYLGLEAVRRRPLSEQAEALGQRIGLSLLAILIGFAVFNDLSRLFQP